MLTLEFAASFGRLAANHLWQSTGFATVAVLLALALRANHARARYWLWLAASVKFLVPFSVLAAIGSSLGRWFVPATPVSRLPVVMERIVQPFAPIQDAAIPVATSVPASNVLPALLLALWFCGFVAVLLYAWTRWRRVAAAVRSSTPLAEGRELEALRRIRKKAGQEARPTEAWRRFGWGGPPGLPSLVSSTAKLEPGVFGIFRPLLWLPAGIADRLEDAELEAILAHELCHVRRRDNLLACIHMAVEAVFWFHPLVWWLGARLEEERERACDEEVVRMGGEPQIYAESILKVCEFYLASPVACAAGVTGGELKKRIEGIMTNRFTRELSYVKRLLLASAAVFIIATPIAVGLLNPPRGRAQAHAEFEAASVKSAPPGFVNGMKIIMPLPGGPGTSSPGVVRCTNCALSDLVLKAYDIERYQLLGPAWLDTELLITAKVPDGATQEEFRLMLRNLLAERFKLTFHREKKDVPGYALVVGKDGLRLKETVGGESAQGPQGDRPRTTVGKDGFVVVPPGYPANGVFSFRNGDALFSTVAGKASMDQLALELTRDLRQPVADATGLKGKYDFVMYWALELPERPSAPGGEVPVASAPLPTLSEALQKLGLKLERKKAPADLLVVDHVEKAPTEN
jgi:uncharacterized protein (TIGR03435 family)